MTSVIMYSTGYCPYCTKARKLLDKKGIDYIDMRVDIQTELRDEMIQRSGRHTVPQIFINGQAIGGCEDLYALEQEGKLDTLLRGK
ncbi:glutaredoxin 3 [Legionella waltersii]|uniref:Glutaredoxin n=1 Tax=Legionella waltersii TaxID=66969 RepID=A0A0W1AGP3_9GAMM|nr:glutaredoxin 3 [Legionella waltersii]KTD80525.1 glutaredoxin [Legionella waltersii]SNV09453.1 grxC glutaredoxin 3 [Legionella waltersii]